MTHKYNYNILHLFFAFLLKSRQELIQLVPNVARRVFLSLHYPHSDPVFLQPKFVFNLVTLS